MALEDIYARREAAETEDIVGVEHDVESGLYRHDEVQVG
jgi:hypothetical protein